MRQSVMILEVEEKLGSAGSGGQHIDGKEVIGGVVQVGRQAVLCSCCFHVARFMQTFRSSVRQLCVSDGVM